MSAKFAFIFLVITAVAAFIVKRMMDRSDEPSSLEEIVTEVLPFIMDPAALRRKFVRDLRRKRIYGTGRISDIITTPQSVVIEVRDRVTTDASGGAVECDAIYELLFSRQDAPDEVGVDRDVEFTGILIDITASQGTPVLTVDPGELLYIGEEVSDIIDPEDEGSPDAPIKPQ